LASTTLKIGLTGGIASGKSTVCRLFEQHAIPIIDADIIARQLVNIGQTALIEIIDLFGSQILQTDAQLDRTKLRKIIFTDPIAKQQLEEILHPKIRLEIQKQTAQQQSAFTIIAIPLLIEAKMSDLVDRILVIDIEEKIQLNRLIHRDQISIDNAQSIINNQCSRKRRLSLADDVVSNNHSINDLSKQLVQLNKKYQQLATSCHHDDSHGQ